MNNKKEKDIIENLEYALDSRYKSKKESESESVLLMEARLMKMKNLTKGEIIRAKLMQLKLKMEDYIKQTNYDSQNHYHFSNFLKTYIDIIYSTRKQFAFDINIKPIRLSQVINNHREPKDEFLMKLMLHSEKVYENICSFNKKIWFQVYFHEKLCDTMSNQDKWRERLEKEIKFKSFK